MQKRADYKYSLVWTVVSLRADAAPYNKITSNMKQAKLLFLLIAALAFIRNDIDETLGNYIKFRALCIYLFDYMHSSVDVEL